ncbi:arylsulfatase B isoform X3 [Hydra vulgaris]|uniref:arylsulfatase B isoform X3 n=2 Tax=Hydra vulgaris TaxID=6087 RepID=UPI001F5E866E|nr:arylsulfatase B isoform X2 [Hydra vulgaris]
MNYKNVNFVKLFWATFMFIKINGEKPHIILIVADDLGWNDIGFHGSKEISTPNIDRLATNGVVLDNYYVLPICTPSRSAIMTGRYPIHTGMQQDTIYGPNPYGVSLNEKFLPQYLKQQGYKTYGVGKWHLGFFAKEYTPTYRGFDSYYGSYLGKGDYWNHSNTETFSGLDLHDNEKGVFSQDGAYNTEMYTSKAISYISNHNCSEPLFLYLAFQAVHSSNSEVEPLQAPQEWIDKFSYIKHEQRRKYAAMLAYMDYGIGRVHEALIEKKMLDNSVIIFTTDNGGPSNGFNNNWANNFPLRGVKATLFEGGVRGVGFVYSKLIEMSRVSHDLIHVTDWLPTLVSLAGGNVTDISFLDGFDQWATLQNKQSSQRNEILLNIDEHVWKNEALRVGSWKLIKEGLKNWDGWYPPPSYNESMDESLNSSILKCGHDFPVVINHCDDYCLFHVVEDPCEIVDLSKKFPDVLATMMYRLNIYKQSMVPPRNNMTIDSRSDPKLHNGVWQPWEISSNIGCSKI